VHFEVFYTKQSEAELLAFPPQIQRQIKAKIARLQGGFVGDIKKLNASDNIYRLRSGDFRILFEIEGANLVIRTIRDRKEAYE
jgi:mRNA interferase RelE/StbE